MSVPRKGGEEKQQREEDRDGTASGCGSTHIRLVKQRFQGLGFLLGP